MLRPNAILEEMLGKGLPSVHSPFKFVEYLHPGEVSKELIVFLLIKKKTEKLRN